MTNDTNIDELEQSLNIPKFEDELALTDIPRLVAKSINKDARLVTCRTCGTQVWVGPYDIFKCSKGHDTEDDEATDDDPIDFIE